MKNFLIIVGLPLAFTVLFGLIYSQNVVKEIPLTILFSDCGSMLLGGFVGLSVALIIFFLRLSKGGVSAEKVVPARD